MDSLETPSRDQAVSVINPWARRPLALRDRLGAMLAGVVISNRWATHQRGTPDPADQGWPEALLWASQACARGNEPPPYGWRARTQQLASPAAVAMVALPYLWIQADAYGHHRSTVERWGLALELSSEATRICHGLFGLFCEAMAAERATSGANASFYGFATGETDHWGNGLGPAIALVSQSQGQLVTALGMAHHRGWSPATIALVGLLVGLTGGRASLGARPWQRWLMEHSPLPLDPWQGLQANTLERLVSDLYDRWAGVGLPGQTPPPRPLGLRG